MVNHKDYSGRYIEFGDDVLYIDSGTRELRKGKVSGASPNRVLISPEEKGDSEGHRIRKPDQVIIIRKASGTWILKPGYHCN